MENSCNHLINTFHIISDWNLWQKRYICMSVGETLYFTYSEIDMLISERKKFCGALNFHGLKLIHYMTCIHSHPICVQNFIYTYKHTHTYICNSLICHWFVSIICHNEQTLTTETWRWAHVLCQVIEKLPQKKRLWMHSLLPLNSLI